MSGLSTNPLAPKPYLSMLWVPSPPKAPQSTPAAQCPPRARTCGLALGDPRGGKKATAAAAAAAGSSIFVFFRPPVKMEVPFAATAAAAAGAACRSRRASRRLGPPLSGSSVAVVPRRCRSTAGTATRSWGARSVAASRWRFALEKKVNLQTGKLLTTDFRFCNTCNVATGTPVYAGSGLSMTVYTHIATCPHFSDKDKKQKRLELAASRAAAAARTRTGQLMVQAAMMADNSLTKEGGPLARFIPWRACTCT